MSVPGKFPCHFDTELWGLITNVFDRVHLRSASVLFGSGCGLHKVLNFVPCYFSGDFMCLPVVTERHLLFVASKM